MRILLIGAEGKLETQGGTPAPAELSVGAGTLGCVSWMQRRYHAVTCTDALFDPTCPVADPGQPGGQLSPRVAQEQRAFERTLAP